MWTQLPSERLRSWHDFRKEINDLDLTSAIEKTNHLWCYAPFVNHYLTTDQIADWPGPWELLYENYYCDLAKALGMLYTLYLSDYRPQDIELTVCVDSVDRQVYNLVSLAKGKYILNFSFDEVVNKKQLPKTLTVQHRYGAQDLNLDLY